VEVSVVDASIVFGLGETARAIRYLARRSGRHPSSDSGFVDSR
jgi:hypothetical protein